MQRFIGLALMVPEIIRGPLNGKKKPGLNRVKRILGFYVKAYWKGNLSKSPIHFRYRQSILISRLYE